MAKKLSQMTWADVQQEMSIAGSPEKLTQLGKDIEVLMGKTIDATNRAEILNAEFMLQRLLAEIKAMGREYDKSHRVPSVHIPWWKRDKKPDYVKLNGRVYPIDDAISLGMVTDDSQPATEQEYRQYKKLK